MFDPNQILNTIPNGGSVSFAAFAAKVGSIANFLAFASPQTLTRRGSHLTVTCTRAGSITSSGDTVKTATVIETDIAIGANYVISMSNIKGISASRSIARGNLIQAMVTPLANGNFTISGTVAAGFPFGNVKFTKTVNAQGQFV